MRKHLFLPEICRNSNLLGIIIITELITFVMWVIGGYEHSSMSFGIWALYAMWAVLAPCLLLCKAKPLIESVSFASGACIVMATVLMVIAAIEMFIGFQLEEELNSARLFRHSIAGVLISAGVVWFFGFLEGLKRRNMAEAESKVLALQARIQPHFLFNSLNTIAELTNIAPKDAEKAIESLSMLFRASLENERKRHALSNEIKLCREYIHLETWRLQAKLILDWQVDVKTPDQWEVPKLILQPLIENAIVHGQLDDGCVSVSIDIRETENHLSLKVSNTIGVKHDNKQHNGIALENIRERLFVLYDDQQTFRIRQQGGWYSVIMRIPKQCRNHQYRKFGK